MPLKRAWRGQLDLVPCRLSSTATTWPAGSARPKMRVEPPTSMDRPITFMTLPVGSLPHRVVVVACFRS